MVTVVTTGVGMRRAGAKALALALLLSACAGDDDAGLAGDGDATPLTAVALPAPPPGPSPADFAGSPTCASCHVDQYTAWRRSTHGTAGGVPGSTTNPVRVIAPFNGTAIRFRDAVVIPRQSGARFEFVVQRPGEQDTTLVVSGVIGGGHMQGGGTQGFLTAWNDGTQRFLPFDWSKDSRSWFCHTGTRANAGWQPITPSMRLADCGDWPPLRIVGDVPRFSNCQSCHGSGITARFDSTAGRWQTDIRTLAIDCESCHGPAKRHVTLMQSGQTPTADIGLASLGTLDKDQSVATCMGCHALKTRLTSGYVPGATLEDHYSVFLSQLGDAPFTPDGRTRTFAYQEGHYASDCYRNGGMTCTSCHDPHGQGYRTVDGAPIPGRIDDRQCTSCHASKAPSITTHTKHKPGSAGSSCVSCHMPYDQQHELGRAIKYTRSDHSIAIPRPTLDRALGLTGACQGCHATKSTAELDAQVSAWWGALKPHDPAVAATLAARDARTLADATTLLVPGSTHAMAQMAGLSAWLDRAAAANETAPKEATDRLRTLATAPQVDVRATALAALHLSRGADPGTRRFLRKQLEPTPHDDKVDLRRRWAVVLGGIGDAARTGGNADRAITAYRAALAVDPASAPLQVNLGLALAARGDWTGAIAAYQRALTLDPRQPLTAVNLGIALEQAGDQQAATEAYQHAVRADPTHPLGYLNTGTQLLRNERAAEARPWIEKALARDPGLAAGHFQLALVLLQAQDLAGAERAARRALALDTAQAEAQRLLTALQEATASAKTSVKQDQSR